VVNADAVNGGSAEQLLVSALHAFARRMFLLDLHPHSQQNKTLRYQQTWNSSLN